MYSLVAVNLKQTQGRFGLLFNLLDATNGVSTQFCLVQTNLFYLLRIIKLRSKKHQNCVTGWKKSTNHLNILLLNHNTTAWINNCCNQAHINTNLNRKSYLGTSEYCCRKRCCLHSFLGHTGRDLPYYSRQCILPHMLQNKQAGGVMVSTCLPLTTVHIHNKILGQLNLICA
jgi:hypothetical protein